MTYSLVPFAPCPFVNGCVAEFTAGHHIECEWRLDGDTSMIRWPAVASSPARIDGLWQSTCFEWFLGPATGDDYLEFNLSPSQDWNAFTFDAPRRGKEEAAGVEPLAVTIHHSDHEALIAANVALPAAVDLPVRLGLSVVLEDIRGRLHYFALAHRSGKPDFHLPDNHVVVGGSL